MAEPTTPEAPRFAGESYALSDLQRDGRAHLPEDEVVSILMRAYGMRGVEDGVPLVEDALRVMRDGPRAELHEVFIP